jgi:fucose permease
MVAALGFLQVGAEVSLGGWLTTFMLQLRDASPFPAGMVLVGFWVGITVGTVMLDFITPKIGERLAISIYLVIALSLELVFWLVKDFIISAISVCFLGIFLGLVFPTAIVVSTELLPVHLHVAAIGLISTLGSAGAAAFPFALGAISDVKSVRILPPFAFALLATILVFWAILPRKPAIRSGSPLIP